MAIILGISAFYHDSAAALVRDGKIIVAVQEERFTRIKHDPSFPINALKYCLKYSNLTMEDIDAVVFYDKPLVKFERLLETYLSFAPNGLQSFLNSMPIWVKDKLFMRSIIKSNLKEAFEIKNIKCPILFTEHHLSHAASAFYPSSFSEAAILTIDGVGEWCTASIAIGENTNIRILKEMHFPDSVGLLFSSFTYFLGFKVNSGEYKLMGLAPYGDKNSEEVKRFIEIIEKYLVTIYDDGSIFLNQTYFDYAVGSTMVNDVQWEKLFGISRKKEDDEFTQSHFNLANAIQDVTEKIVLNLAKHALTISGKSKLCLAGGVALNCVANGKLLDLLPIENIFIQPAAGDAGGALGAALCGSYLYCNDEREVENQDSMQGAFLGPIFSDEEIMTHLDKHNAKFIVLEDNKLNEEVSGFLMSSKVVGWFQGRSEFGPRALGNRSILANATDPDMQRKLNLKIKFRESFRPFAPIVLKEKANEYFDINGESPYMLFVAKVKDSHLISVDENDIKNINSIRSTLPAITHIDKTARVQTIDEKRNPNLYTLLTSFYTKSKVPVLVNTSFNVRGEPPVLTPEDAYLCFMETELDILVIHNFLLIKEQQPNYENKEIWKRKFDVD